MLRSVSLATWELETGWSVFLAAWVHPSWAFSLIPYVLILLGFPQGSRSALVWLLYTPYRHNFAFFFYRHNFVYNTT